MDVGETQSIIKFIHFIVLVTFSYVILNRIRKHKLPNLRKNKNNNFDLWKSMFNDLFFVPIILFMHWIVYILIIKIVYWFIIFSVKVNTPVDPDDRANMGSSMMKIFFYNIFIDIKMFAWLFIFNILILFILLPIIIITNRKNIEITYNIYEIIITLYICILYWKIYKF